MKKVVWFLNSARISTLTFGVGQLKNIFGFLHHMYQESRITLQIQNLDISMIIRSGH